MLRTKISEIGRLTLLDDGGLVCAVTLQVAFNEPLPFDAEGRAGSHYWAQPKEGELSVGDLVLHPNHGVARYRGRKILNGYNGEHLLLEYARGSRLYVPLDRSHLVLRIGGADCAPIQWSTLNDKGSRGGKWRQSFCVEVLPSAYAWPGIGTLPELPKESAPGVMADWRQACATYLATLHEDASYRRAAQEYFERQSRKPQHWLDWWIYRGTVLRAEPMEAVGIPGDEHLLLIKQYVLRRERKVGRIQREVEVLENSESLEEGGREPIPEHVRLFVWRRDKGQCVRCGSRERLEFDHIIPVVAGGSNTERNIQLLCESCNRSKSATV
ncbi:MAG TPA: HNH endonuclease [Terriglobales bacterium]|nr:HNH endonuclease [Terriglobales bacterium]